jgi:L-asparaginase
MLLITTGGTIAGEVADNRKDEDYEVKGAEAFSDLIRPTIMSIKKETGVELIIETENAEDPIEVDSSDIKPHHWTRLADTIKDNYDNYDSFVITHGTNTLGYTCAALSFALFNNKKPVVLTGSQVPIGVPGSDAQTNLENALRVACWHRHEIHGVVAVFGSHIISGSCVKKSTEFDYDAFVSFNSGSLGRIGRIIAIDEDNLKKHNSYRSTSAYPAASTSRALKVDSRFCKDICSLTEFPGMNPDIFKQLVLRLDIKGFILRAFGAGDASGTLGKALEFLKDEGIPIIITTQAPNGNANMQVNEPGQYIKEHGLGIPAYDMGIESQTTKLAWLLAQKEAGELTYKQVCEKVTIDIRGEIKTMWEDEFGT